MAPLASRAAPVPPAAGVVADSTALLRRSARLSICTAVPATFLALFHIFFRDYSPPFPISPVVLCCSFVFYLIWLIFFWGFCATSLIAFYFIGAFLADSLKYLRHSWSFLAFYNEPTSPLQGDHINRSILMLISWLNPMNKIQLKMSSRARAVFSVVTNFWVDFRPSSELAEFNRILIKVNFR